MSNTKCKNCDTEFQGSFCSACGQKSTVSKINLSYTIQELQATVLQHDKGLFHTAKELFYRPGHSIRDYLGGKRVKHFKPLAYVLVLSTILTFLNYLFGIESYLVKGVSSMIEGWNSHDSSDQLSFSMIKWMSKNYAYCIMLMIPFFSMATYVAFRKSGYNYYEHIVINSYITGQQTIIQILFIPFLTMLPEGSLLNGLESLKLILLVSLVFWTFIQLFNNKKLGVKIFLIILSYIIILLLSPLLLFVAMSF